LPIVRVGILADGIVPERQGSARCAPRNSHLLADGGPTVGIAVGSDPQAHGPGTRPGLNRGVGCLAWGSRDSPALTHFKAAVANLLLARRSWRGWFGCVGWSGCSCWGGCGSGRGRWILGDQGQVILIEFGSLSWRWRHRRRGGRCTSRRWRGRRRIGGCVGWCGCVG
jgi:hypothetical protein